MSSRAPSVESFSEISLHPNDDMYRNLDFLVAGVQNRSPRANHNSPTRSRLHGPLSRSVSVNSHRDAYGDFEVKSEYRASRDRSPLRRSSFVEQRGQFHEPEGYYDDRYSRERYFDGDSRAYRGVSGPSRSVMIGNGVIRHGSGIVIVFWILDTTWVAVTKTRNDAVRKMSSIAVFSGSRGSAVCRTTST